MKRTPLRRKKRLTAKPKAKRRRAHRSVDLGGATYVIALSDLGLCSTQPDPKPAGPWRSEAYLDHVRTKPCCVCGKPGPNDAHHWGGKGSHGTGQKCSDARTAPVCRAHHDQWHSRGAFSSYRWAGEGVPVTAHMLSREESERIQIEAQRDCLAEWVERHC